MYFISEVEAGPFSSYMSQELFQLAEVGTHHALLELMHYTLLERDAVCGLESTLAVITLQLSGTWLIAREHVKKAHRCHKNHGF